MSKAEEKVVYLMRGLPSSGKSYTARRIADRDGGRVFETDSFFMSQVGNDSRSYDFTPELIPKAQAWNFERYKVAISRGVSPIVVDRGNSLSLDSKVYAVFAKHFGYTVRLSEPESRWWQKIRVLLKNKEENRSALQVWAKGLARMNASTHKVPVDTILHWMEHWKHDLTVDDIIDYKPRKIPPHVMNKMTLKTPHLFDKHAVNDHVSNDKVQPVVSKLLNGGTVAAAAVLPINDMPLIYDDATGHYLPLQDAQGIKDTEDKSHDGERQPKILWEEADKLLDFIS